MSHIVQDLAEGRRLIAEEIGRARAVVVFTGAGISTESGIPDFRSPGGLWSRMRPIQYDEFLADEDARLEEGFASGDLDEVARGSDPV